MSKITITKEGIDAIKRIKAELDDLTLKPIINLGSSVGLINLDNVFEWQCIIVAPKDTPYEKGFFLLHITFPKNYPHQAPNVCFKTPIYHVNVNPCKSANHGNTGLGNICIRTLYHWKPEYNIRKVLENIGILFYMENPNNPYSLERAYEVINNRPLYEKKIRYFTQKYASIENYSKCPDCNWDFTYSEV